MEIEFCKGFTVYRNGFGPTYVAMHSGPSIEMPTSRDDNSDTVASLCWLKTGGNLVISGITRKRCFGVDFNRDIPPKELAKKMYNEFIKDEDQKKLHEYRKRYGWVAKNDVDYNTRLSVYKEFWSKIRRLGSFTVFIHRKYTRLKNYPSLMDLVSFYGLGIKRAVLKKIVDELNQKNMEFFKAIWPRFKEAIVLEHKRILENINKKFGTFELKKLHGEYRENLEKDLDVAKKWTNKRIWKRFQNNFTPTNFIMVVRSTLTNGPIPMITLEQAFRGGTAIGPQKQYIGKSKNISIEIECSEFASFWYPEKMSNIIIDLINKIKTAEMYKKMGFSQTKIIKFIKN